MPRHQSSPQLPTLPNSFSLDPLSNVRLLRASTLTSPDAAVTKLPYSLLHLPLPYRLCGCMPKNLKLAQKFIASNTLYFLDPLMYRSISPEILLGLLDLLEYRTFVIFYSVSSSVIATQISLSAANPLVHTCLCTTAYSLSPTFAFAFCTARYFCTPLPFPNTSAPPTTSRVHLSSGRLSSNSITYAQPFLNSLFPLTVLIFSRPFADSWLKH